MKNINFKMISLAIFSAVSIAYELFIMRVFSIGSWSNFGFLVISTALLGFGLAGTLLCFLNKSIKKSPQRWISVTAIVFIPTMVLGFVLTQQIPFNPIFVTSDLFQLFWIAVYYILFGIPFFMIALFTGLIFITLSSRINQLYFWNMAGSGLGGLIIILCMYVIPPQHLLLPLLLLSLIAAFLSFLNYSPANNRVMVKREYLISLGSVVVASLIVLLLFGNIKVSEFKSISYVRKYPDARLVHHSFSPMGEIDVFNSSRFHSAPGLSDIAIIDLKEIPKQDFWGLYTDGDGPFQVMGKLEESSAAYMDYLPLSAPYTILDKPDVLLANLNGGISAQLALYKNARKITIVEPNYELVGLLRDDPVLSKFNDHLLLRGNVSVVTTNPRAYCASHPDSQDLIEISLIDSIGSNGAWGHSINENFTYTKEAIADYMQALKQNGILAITVWNGLIPPRNVPKILSSIIVSLREQNIRNIDKRLFVFDLHRSTATILIKNTDFIPGEINNLVSFIRDKAFDPVYYPGIPKNPRSYESIMATYRNYFTNEVNMNEVKRDTSILDFKSSDFYHHMILEMLAGREEALFRNYIFDISPMTDDRPYYSVYLKPVQMSYYLDQLPDIMEEWGLLLVIGIFMQSILFGAIIILLPLFGRFKVLLVDKKAAVKTIIYFSCLGLGYMFMEMFLIQRLVFFISDPIFSVSIVLTSMLIISGIGSIISGRFQYKRSTVVLIAVGGIVASSLFYLFGLSPLLRSLQEIHFALKVIISIIIIAPSAFFLGMPFPNGLRAISDHMPDLLPWTWGMNGALSVTGAVLCRLISITFGFSLVLVLTMAIYITAALTFPTFAKKLLR
ncbi:MAG: hypothetical protein JW904_10235 [Spirochaetales bacterium]|nr:hypothetical protein [Spirochaetales bacterium]